MQEELKQLIIISQGITPLLYTTSQNFCCYTLYTWYSRHVHYTSIHAQWVYILVYIHVQWTLQTQCHVQVQVVHDIVHWRDACGPKPIQATNSSYTTIE